MAKGTHGYDIQFNFQNSLLQRHRLISSAESKGASGRPAHGDDPKMHKGMENETKSARGHLVYLTFYLAICGKAFVLYEIGSLIFNPTLPLIAMGILDGAFDSDVKLIDGLYRVRVPPELNSLEFKWRDGIFDIRIFRQDKAQIKEDKSGLAGRCAQWVLSN